MNLYRKHVLGHVQSLVLGILIFAFVLANFMPIWYNLREGNPNWVNTLIRSGYRQACRTFSLFVTDGGGPIVGGTHSWTGGPGLYFNKAGWASYGEQANKQHSSMPPRQWPLPGSCPVWALVLTPSPDAQWYGIISKINSFLPNLLWVIVLHHSRSSPI